jgi:hypothetical protein
MTTTECPRYQRCSAAICPLWGSVLDQKMVKGERVCGVLLEYQKVETRAKLTTCYGQELMWAMGQATDQIKSHGGYWLRSALERAESTSSRLNLLHPK